VLSISFAEKHTVSESRKLRVFLSMVSMTLSWGTQHQDIDCLRYIGERTWKFFVCSSIPLKISVIFLLSSSFSRILFHVALFDILLSSITLSTSILHNIRIVSRFKDRIEYTWQSARSSPLILPRPHLLTPYSQQRGVRQF